MVPSAIAAYLVFFFFSSRRRHTRWNCDWSSDVCSSDLVDDDAAPTGLAHGERQVAIVAVEEPVGLVDAAHRLQHRPAQAEADAVDHRDLLPRRVHGRAVGEAVDDRAAG